MINKILKYNEFLNEKISDKLSGFNEEDLKNQYLNGKISLEKFANLCKKYEIILNNIDINELLYVIKNYTSIELCDYFINNYIYEPFDILHREYINCTISPEYYFKICKKFNIELPNITILNDMYLKKHFIGIKDYINYSKMYYNVIPEFKLLENAYYEHTISINDYLQYSKKYYNHIPDRNEFIRLKNEGYITILQYIDLLNEYLNIKPSLSELQYYLNSYIIDKKIYNNLIKKYNIEQ